MKKFEKMMIVAAAAAMLTGCASVSALSAQEAEDLIRQQEDLQEAIVVEVDRDRSEGVCELEVVVGDQVYEYEVDIRTGEILRVEQEYEAKVPPASQPAETVPVETPARETEPRNISREEAISAALGHSGVGADQAGRTECEWDDGCWEIEFEANGCEYEYRIAGDGTVLEADREASDPDCDWDDDDDDDGCDRNHHSHGGHHG